MVILKERRPLKKKRRNKIYLIRSKEESRDMYVNICKIRLFVEQNSGELCFDGGIFTGYFLTSKELRLIADYLDKRNKKLLNTPKPPKED